jgi:hypothetical protein
MRTIFLDFETYWDQQYSLRNMTPVQYILDPRFEVQLLTVRDGLGGTTYHIDGPDVAEFFRTLPQEVAVVSYNALFDMCICAWVYGYVPKLMIDMLGVARARLGGQMRSLSLDKVAKHLGADQGVTGALRSVRDLRHQRHRPHVRYLPRTRPQGAVPGA